MMNSNGIFLDSSFGLIDTGIRPASCVSVIGEVSDQEFERLSDALAGAFDGRTRQWEHPVTLGGVSVRNVEHDDSARGGTRGSGSGSDDVRCGD